MVAPESETVFVPVEGSRNLLFWAAGSSERAADAVKQKADAAKAQASKAHMPAKNKLFPRVLHVVMMSAPFLTQWPSRVPPVSRPKPDKP